MPKPDQKIQKRRTCRFCDAKDIYIDYKDEKRLKSDRSHVVL